MAWLPRSRPLPLVAVDPSWPVDLWAAGKVGDLVEGHGGGGRLVDQEINQWLSFLGIVFGGFFTFLDEQRSFRMNIFRFFWRSWDDCFG